ncbi:uncharacterized protein KY384_008098 [Bacidia gigantensis]|uniref:uncharacterized protein n=1 Tax=Bacidia gigantensis TaxID=2732470 RepID=UPI001D0389EB|nr:uncharacterized protein KY384_008098 [Bacidia gigantensis]KAG8526669.1 hypothetical protein KY384_008098 [Bacidia gigantensis]
MSPTTTPAFSELIVVKFCEQNDMDPIPEETDESLEVPVILVPDLPPLKYHDGPLRFLSNSLMSQREWERKLITIGPTLDLKAPPDEDISIRCPNGDEDNPKLFTISKAALARAPIFRNFFKSEHYAWGSDTLISIMSDPAAAFDIVQRYLEQGPELFDMTCLRVYVYKRYNSLERTVVLVRLYRMAHSMGLWFLEDLAYEVLVDGNRYVTAAMMPTLAGLIFAPRGNHNDQIKNWCLVHIGHFFLDLKDCADWSRCLTLCEDRLTQEWNKMLFENTRILGIMSNESRDSVLEKTFKHMSLQEQDRAISVISKNCRQSSPTVVQTPNTATTTTLTANSSSETLAPLLKPIAFEGFKKNKQSKKKSKDDDEWEDIGTPTQETFNRSLEVCAISSPYACGRSNCSEENYDPPLSGRTLIEGGDLGTNGMKLVRQQTEEEEFAKVRAVLGMRIDPKIIVLSKASTEPLEELKEPEEVTEQNDKGHGHVLKKKGSVIKITRRRTRILGLLR